MPAKHRFVFVVWVTLVAMLSAAVVLAQGPQPQAPYTVQANLGTTFTYQGQLKNGGGAVNGNCDFQFALYDALTLGSRMATTQTVSSLTVTNGLFAAPIDFGAGAFSGDARFLNIQVRCPAGAGAYTALTTRQALTPAPMALSLPGLWTQQNATSPNLIGGYSGNVISPTVAGSVIGGGGASGAINRVTGSYSTIGGGDNNTASLDYSTIGGGFNNRAAGDFSTVAGGQFNTASGLNSFAAGNHANTNYQDGTFVWADHSSGTDFNAIGPNQFIVRAVGGVGINTNFIGPDQFIVHAADGVSINTDSTIANALTVKGQVFAGNPTVYGPIEPFVSTGNASGLSLEDRAGGNPRWVIYPDSGVLRFFNDTHGDVVTISNTGKLSANGGFNGLCLSNASNPFDTNMGRACNMDVAEAFASDERTAPGDLVALVPQSGATPTVVRATRAYDNLLVGVVSQNPGLVFDNGQTHLAGDNSQLISADKTVVALVGRVLANASTENGPIAAGDPLTSASTPGAAMKATHAGKIIGYALEPSQSNGQVLVLLQPGTYLPDGDLATQTENAQLKGQVAALDARLAALEQREPAAPTWLIAGGALMIGMLLAGRFGMRPS